MTEFRSPPPPLFPPPSRETDIVFGALLSATGVLIFLFFSYIIVCGPFGVYTKRWEANALKTRPALRREDDTEGERALNIRFDVPPVSRRAPNN